MPHYSLLFVDKARAIGAEFLGELDSVQLLYVAIRILSMIGKILTKKLDLETRYVSNHRLIPQHLV